VEDRRVPPFVCVRSMASSPPEVFVFMMLPLSTTQSWNIASKSYPRWHQNGLRTVSIGITVIVGGIAENARVVWEGILREGSKKRVQSVKVKDILKDILGHPDKAEPGCRNQDCTN
jgi:hypothetical protein